MQNYFVFNEGFSFQRNYGAVSSKESNAKIWHGNYDVLSASIIIGYARMRFNKLAFLEDRFRVA